MDSNLIQIARECAEKHRNKDYALIMSTDAIEQFAQRIRAAALREALLEVEQEKTVQSEHYGMCSALAQGGSKMHRAECESTEGVILGCEYIAERLKKMAEGDK
jgi:hypothetical protein